MAVALAVVAKDGVEMAVEAVIAAGRYAAERQWVPATSGNFSVRIDDERIAITRSGVDKGSLTPADILIQRIDRPLLPGSSAEAALHVRQYADDPAIGAIFHIHGLYSTVIGQAPAPPGCVRAQGYLLAGHGLYAWGKTIKDAMRHLEALEVLFAQFITLRSFQS